ncbi:MAG: hypothetical protein EOM50_07020 [Erysipelotrichia bacterium]|nr:hypothetical protein [Erysipelotrichia bacterium]NCC54704.1 hypothetical protein [Erysipelotrichia bacterium]
MKKTILSMIIFVLLLQSVFTPIHANDKIEILIAIKGDQYLYIVTLQDHTLQVKSVSSHLYTKISCLDNEYATLKSVDFTSSYPCLVNTLNQRLHTNIGYYVAIDMPALLNALHLKEDAYDYQSLHSLTNVAKQILDRFKLSLLIHYQDFVESDLDVNTMYELYCFFTKEKFTTKYYFLNYIVMNHQYYLLDASFHLKK